jgi:hypothetical protein
MGRFNMAKVGIAIIFDNEKDAEKFGQSLIDWSDNEIKILAEGRDVPWTDWYIDRNDEGALKLFRYLSESQDDEDTLEIDSDEEDTIEIDPLELGAVD